MKMVFMINITLINFRGFFQMKTTKLNINSLLGAFSLTFALFLLVSCSPNDSQNNSSLESMNRALEVASSTMTTMDKTTSPENTTVTKASVMDDFSKKYADKLNNDPKMAKYKPIAVIPEADGSFSAYTDANNNQIKDADEKILFKLEADTKNGRLVASNEAGVAEQPHSFMGGGFFMGMLLGNMLSRQRMTGANPSARRATPKARKSPGFRQSPNARSRVGSGSHASGK